MPEVLCPTDLVGIVNRARKEARKAGDVEAADILGKLLFLAHPGFHQMEAFPARFDEGAMSEVQLNEIKRRLRPLMCNSDDVQRWLDSPHPLLGDRRPSDCSYSEVKRQVLQMRREHRL